jgi:hypothetical protein
VKFFPIFFISISNIVFAQDGSLDPTFDFDGKKNTDFGLVNDFAHAIAIQSDGKIVAAGKIFERTIHNLVLLFFTIL